MAAFYDHIKPDLAEWIEKQPMFFVASAPLDSEGRVNLSPKGLDSFRLLSPHQVAYLDLTGSGNETSAHLKENGRMTFMFCAFEGAPRILRLYGKGQVVLPGDTSWAALASQFNLLPGTRQVIVCDVETVQTSCGFAVPLMDFVGQRDTLIKFAERKGVEGMETYRAEQNTQRIDGLPTHLATETNV
ncbi:MAG: pyridoxamine 5'-phosphate oxidase family protein [Chloroflexota bacterium]